MKLFSGIVKVNAMRGVTSKRPVSADAVTATANASNARPNGSFRFSAVNGAAGESQSEAFESFQERQMPSVLIMILTFNEAENLSALLEQVFNVAPDADVLVIDDDSPDGTGELARRIAREHAQLKVVSRQGERGLGRAMRFGLQHAVDHGYDFVVNMDADFSHDPNDIPRLIEAATDEETTIDLVIGSRYVGEGRVEGWSWRRRVMSQLVNRFARSVLRLPVSDCSGGFRCYRVSRLREIELGRLRSGGYSIQEELLMKLKACGGCFKEIPITFVDRQHGRSKLTSVEALRSAWKLLQLALS